MKSLEEILREMDSAFASVGHGGALFNAPDDLTTKQLVSLVNTAALSSGLHAMAASIERLVDEGITIYNDEV